jgi:signal transduction histidine kinase
MSGRPGRRRIDRAIALCLLLVPAAAAALERPLDQCTVEVWRAKDGLPGNSLRALAQTPDGRLWAATLGGLAQYDGRHWTVFSDPKVPRATLGELLGLQVTDDGSLWLLPLHRGPIRLVRGSPQMFGAPAEVRAWTARGGELWLAAADGLFRFAGDRFAPVPVPGLEGAQVLALQAEVDGPLWIGTNRGLFMLDGERLTRAPEVRPDEPVPVLHRTRRGILWAAAGGRLVGLPSGEVHTRADGLPTGPIAALADDRDGNLWIGAPGGLARLGRDGLRLFTGRDGLPDDEISSLLVDREETLWVGTRRGGVAQLTDRTLATVGALAGIDLESMCEAGDTSLWFGTRQRGVARWREGKLTMFTAADGLPSNSVHAVLPDGADAVWLGTSRGLARFRGGKIEDPHVWDRFVAGLFRDRSGALWISGNGELGRYTGTLKVFRPEHGIPAGQLRAVAQDGQGAIWVSAVGGLVRADRDRFVVPALERGLGGVRAMLASRDGSFWMSTVGMGLLRVRDGRVRAFDAHSGLDLDRLSQLLEDDAENLWVGAHNKILRIDRASLDAVADGRRATVDSLAFETTDHRAAVIAERVRQPSAWKASDGRLWFVTDQGPVVIDPRHVRTNPVAPTVEIESVTVDGRAAEAGARLPAGPGRLVVQYGAVTLLQPGRVRYRYRLEGVDGGWVEAGAARNATYLNLRPGPYTFHVLASNSDGLWNERGASVAFALGAPFYRSPWFFGACGLLALGLVFAAHRLHLARVRAEYVLLLAERNRMARELHDTLLQGMSAAALHLTGLRAEAHDAPAPLQKDLALIQDTISRTLQESRQAVWGLREGGTGRPGDFATSLERLARRLCGARQVTCDFVLEGTPAILSHTVEDELHKIGQEAMANALAHGAPKTVTVRLCYHARAVTLTISDDGAGFDPSGPAPEGHFGVQGMRERAARIGATLDLRSGAGTTVEVKVARP